MFIGMAKLLEFTLRKLKAYNCTNHKYAALSLRQQRKVLRTWGLAGLKYIPVTPTDCQTDLKTKNVFFRLYPAAAESQLHFAEGGLWQTPDH